MNIITKLVNFLVLTCCLLAQGTAAEVNNIMVRVVKVTPDWMPYWEDAFLNAAGIGVFPIKETESLKIYDVAVWEENKSIQLYAIPNDYWQNKPAEGNEAKIAYRESFAIARFDSLPDANTIEGVSQRSDFIKNSMKFFVSILIEQHPNAAHHLTYSGHGGPGGALFAAMLGPKHVTDLLSHWRQELGKNLGFIDMGGPCNKGGFSDLETFSKYADYYVASDLPNGGYTLDEWTIEKFLETEPDNQYHRLLSEHSNLLDALKERMDLKRKGYEYSKQNMIQNKVEQGNYLYSCQNFITFSTAFKAYMLEKNQYFYSSSEDMYDFLLAQNNDSLIALYNEVILHQANNRDFFEWEVSANGLITPNRLESDLTLNMVEPHVELPADFSAQENEQVAIEVTAYDIEFDILNYTWRQLSGPNVLTGTEASANISFTVPDVSTDTILEIEVTVDDGEYSISDSITVSVQNDITSVEQISNAIPNDFRLGQNYPNPFNPTTSIEFDLPKSGFVALKVYNVLGKEVVTLVSKNLQAGKYNVQLEANDLASGVYWYKLQLADFIKTKKMLLVR